MDAKKLEPLREMAAKWREWADAHSQGDDCFNGAAAAKRVCADEIDAFCDAAEAAMIDEAFEPDSHDENVVEEKWVRRVLLGEKKP